MSKWPYFSDDEIEAATNVLRSGKVNFWTGNECSIFESEFSSYIGTKHAIAVANGTVSLELALQALGVKSGDEVITTPRSFIATASSIVRLGAKPVFADVDLVSQNITVQSMRECLTKKTKGIIVVHLAGWPCDMDEIMEFANSHSLFVIEDCAQAHGAHYKGKKVGSWGDFGSFSFCQDKIMTTCGEGGMLVTNNTNLFQRARSYKDHGKDFDLISRLKNNKKRGFQWVHSSFGTNYRMTEIQAAVGRKQLVKLDGWLAKRNKFARMLNNQLGGLNCVRITPPPSDIGHAYYKYYFFLRPDKLKPGWNRDKIIEILWSEGVACYTGICPAIYQESAFKNSEYYECKSLKNAELLGETSLMLAVHPTLSEIDMQVMLDTVLRVLNEVTLISISSDTV